MPTQKTSRATYHYIDKGSGPKLVLLHAFPVNSQMWQGQIDRLADRFRVIAPDFPGFGQSPGIGPFTVPAMAEMLHEFLDAVTLNERIVLGGLSMGGYVAIHFAQKYPDLLRGLILADTKDTADSAEQRENRNRMIEVAKTKGSSAVADLMMGKMLAPDAESKRPVVAQELRKLMEQTDAQTIQYALAALRDRPDMSEALKSFAMPTLILVGDGDSLTPTTVAEAMQKRIRHSELELIPGAGHMSAMEQPSQVSHAIAHFMQKLK